MEMRIKKALDGKTWAVAGANVNPAKFGNRIYLRLKQAGYTTYPMNPVYSEIDGDPCYSSPEELPSVPDCVNMVLSPDKGIALLKPMYEKGIRLLWFQPGSFDQQILDEAVAKGFEIIYDHCVLIELNNTGK